MTATGPIIWAIASTVPLCYIAQANDYYTKGRLYMKKCILLAVLALALVAVVVWKVYGKDKYRIRM